MLPAVPHALVLLPPRLQGWPFLVCAACVTRPSSEGSSSLPRWERVNMKRSSPVVAVVQVFVATERELNTWTFVVA